jgi:hypothetical protein
VLPHPHQQWGGEYHNALFEAGGECFLMEGQFNSIHSSTSGATEQSPSNLFPVTTNRSLAFTREHAASSSVRGGQKRAQSSQALRGYVADQEITHFYANS